MLRMAILLVIFYFILGGLQMSTINNSYEYYESNQSLLSMLNSKKTGNELINQIISNNEIAYQKKMEEMGVTTNSSNSAYTSVSNSSSSLMDSIETLSSSDLYNEESEGYDKSTLLKNVSNFVTAYNNEISNLTSCGGSLYDSFYQEFASSFSANSEALNAIGISMNDEGKLIINQDTLSSASVEDLNALFGSESSYTKLLSTSAEAINTIVSKALSYSSSNYTSSGTLLNYLN